jgi:hypothetical protein
MVSLDAAIKKRKEKNDPRLVADQQKLDATIRKFKMVL